MLRILLTRPREQAQKSARLLREIGIVPVSAPMMAYEALNVKNPPDPEQLSGIIFTSSYAITTLEAAGCLAPYLGLKAYTAGDGTTRAAQKAGFKRIDNARGTSAHLVSRLMRSDFQHALLYPCAKIISLDIARALAPSGRSVISWPVYAMKPVAELPETVLRGIKEGVIGAGMFYSQRTATQFAALTAGLLDTVKHNFTAICLSANVAQPMKAAHFTSILVADHPNEEAMMRLALSFSRGQITPI